MPFFIAAVRISRSLTFIDSKDLSLKSQFSGIAHAQPPPDTCRTRRVSGASARTQCRTPQVLKKSQRPKEVNYYGSSRIAVKLTILKTYKSRWSSTNQGRVKHSIAYLCSDEISPFSQRQASVHNSIFRAKKAQVTGNYISHFMLILQQTVKRQKN